MYCLQFQVFPSNDSKIESKNTDSIQFIIQFCPDNFHQEEESNIFIIIILNEFELNLLFYY